MKERRLEIGERKSNMQLVEKVGIDKKEVIRARLFSVAYPLILTADRRSN